MTRQSQHAVSNSGMTNPNPLAVIILAAGQGTRMTSALPKVLHKVAGLPMLGHVIKAAESLQPQKIIIIAAPAQVDAFKPYVGHHTIAVQDQQLGTGHAVRCAESALKNFSGDVLVLYGDVPLIKPVDLQKLIDAKHTANTELAVMGFETNRAYGFGRLMTDGDTLLEIIEQKDLPPQLEWDYRQGCPPQPPAELCNTGVMCVTTSKLWLWLAALKTDNNQGEYYLTDIVKLAHTENVQPIVIKTTTIAATGVNDRLQLQSAEFFFQHYKISDIQENGVTLLKPDTVYFAHDTQIAPDVIIHPHVVFGPGVTIDSGAEILSFSHLEGCTIKSGAKVGPFARIRPGTIVEPHARVGNFVELKNTTLGAGAKINHLSYVGDTTVGAAANIGAGTITCNYDGFNKYHTHIGAGAFIGSNSALIAPVTIGDNAIVAAGSVIAKDVPSGALGIARALQKNLANWADAFRAKMKDKT